MKVAVIGAGAIGSVVAGYLTKAGSNVILIGREDHVRAINDKGLIIEKHDGSETIKLNASTRLKEDADLVIFATKTQDLEQAYQDNIEFLIKPLVMTSQNGVQADTLLSSHFEREQLISSIVMFGSTYIEPGKVTYNFPGDWIIGKPYTPNDLRLQDIADELRKGFDIVVTSDISGMKWLKLFINFNNCIPALVGKSMQETFSDLDMCRLSIRLLKEGLDIVKKAGIELVSLPQFPADRVYGLAAMPEEQAAGIMNKTLTTLSKEPLYGSILQSIKRNKVSEIDFINGEIAVIAKGIRQESPLNRKVVDMVHQVERSRKFFGVDELKKEFSLN